ncbi:MAG: hypothetical protein AB7H43_14960, partial [Acidimicrobiia bacterium]
LISELVGGVEVTVLEQVAFLEQRPRNQTSKRGRRNRGGGRRAQPTPVAYTTSSVVVSPAAEPERPSTVDRLRQRTVRKGPRPTPSVPGVDG